MNVGDFVFAEYDNGEMVNGEIVQVRDMPPGKGHETERVLLTIKAEQGFRSIYLDKCITFDVMQSSN